MLERIDHHSQAPMVNPHHPQAHFYQTMPGEQDTFNDQRIRSEDDATDSKEAIDHHLFPLLRAWRCNKPVSMLFFVITSVKYEA
jgi:hypothetical protein